MGIVLGSVDIDGCTDGGDVRGVTGDAVRTRKTCGNTCCLAGEAVGDEEDGAALSVGFALGS